MKSEKNIPLADNVTVEVPQAAQTITKIIERLAGTFLLIST